MSRIAVMHLVDTLMVGGTERNVIHLTNTLPADRFRVTLCTTRSGGNEARAIAPHVEHLSLHRRGRWDTFGALQTLVTHVQRHGIRLLHPHGTSLFLARLVAAFPPYPAIIWHLHAGRLARKKNSWHYRLAVRGVSGFVASNDALTQWLVDKMNLRADRVWYLPNIALDPGPQLPLNSLPGVPGSRIVCVANVRPEKDHPNLLEAMAQVVQHHPEAQLLLVGAGRNPDSMCGLNNAIQRFGLRRHVSWLGQRDDVPAIIRTCDIGTLSSSSEGLPVSLLEYGMAGLPSVVTDVGQAAEVVDHGRAGILVPPRSPAALARGLVTLLDSPDQRARLGRRLRANVQQKYSPGIVIAKLCRIYDTVLETKGQQPLLRGDPVRPREIEPVPRVPR